jgi:protein-S-isoprenylcysteine O-methyltransferase Ste14
MSQEDPAARDRPNTIYWPPILEVAVLAIAYGLHQFIALPAVIQRPVDVLIGWPLVLLGLALALVAIVRFRIVGTAIDPTARANALATGGIYQFTRNPMYLGIIVAFLGLGIALQWTWLLVLNLILPLALQKLAIEREEAYLERRFGDGYRAYKARVRRWL